MLNKIKSCIAVWRVTHLFNLALLTAPSLWSACLEKLFPAGILHCAKIPICADVCCCCLCLHQIHYKVDVLVFCCKAEFKGVIQTEAWIFWCCFANPKKSAVCKSGLVLVPTTEPSGQSHSEFSHIDLLHFSPIDLSFPYRSSFNMCNRRPKYSEV